jgi:hypothetical protein
MSDKIKWSNVTVTLGQLKPWSINPRTIDREHADRLNESFDEFGQVEPIIIGPGNEVYNGHQRLNVLMLRFGKTYEIEARQSSRPLTEQERKKLTIFLHKGTIGVFDKDALANNFDFDDLIDWGFKPGELDMSNAPEMDDPDEDEETSFDIRPKTFLRVLVSIPVDFALDARPVLDALELIPGIEVDYGAN